MATLQEVRNLPRATADPLTGAVTISHMNEPLPLAPYLAQLGTPEIMPTPIPAPTARTARVGHAAPEHALAS